MKTTVDIVAFRDALSHVRNAVAAKTALPILSNILIDADGDRITLKATDLKVAVISWVPAEIDDPGMVSVDARLLWEFVANLPSSGPLTLTLDPIKLGLRARMGGSDARFNGVDPRDFPDIVSEIDPERPTFAVPAEVMDRAYRLVSIAVADNESRPVLAGISFRPGGDGGLAFASSEGFVMSAYTAPVEGVPSDLDIIVPGTTFRVLAGILPKDGDLTMQVTPNRSQVIAAFGSTVWTSRLIEGTYPPVAQIIPRSQTTQAELDGETLLLAVRQAMVFGVDNNNVIRITVAPGEDDLSPGTLTIAGRAKERGEGTGALTALVDGPAVEIAFNGKYIRSALEAMKQCGRAVIGLNGSEQAATIRGSGVQGYTFVAMPMRTEEPK